VRQREDADGEKVGEERGEDMRGRVLQKRRRFALEELRSLNGLGGVNWGGDDGMGS
jgi:hypothetical protein